jgi:hypothetical protein
LARKIENRGVTRARRVRQDATVRVFRRRLTASRAACVCRQGYPNSRSIANIAVNRGPLATFAVCFIREGVDSRRINPPVVWPSRSERWEYHPRTRGAVCLVGRVDDLDRPRRAEPFDGLPPRFPARSCRVVPMIPVGFITATHTVTATSGTIDNGGAAAVGIVSIMGGGLSITMAVVCLICFAVAYFMGRRRKALGQQRSARCAPK